MTDATDQPPGFYASDGNSDYLLPAQPGEFLGRILDPVRAKALHEAVNLSHAVEIVVHPDDDVPGLVVLWARTFETYLDPETE